MHEIHLVPKASAMIDRMHYCFSLIVRHNAMQCSTIILCGPGQMREFYYPRGLMLAAFVKVLSYS